MDALIVAAAAGMVAWVLLPVVRRGGTAGPVRHVGALACPRCGPRPEAEARYCSECGAPMTGPAAR